jgi:hypothetical protein
LNKDLPVAKIRLLGVVPGNVIGLQHAIATENAIYGDLPEWTGVEHGRR